MGIQQEPNNGRFFFRFKPDFTMWITPDELRPLLTCDNKMYHQAINGLTALYHLERAKALKNKHRYRLAAKTVGAITGASAIAYTLVYLLNHIL